MEQRPLRGGTLRSGAYDEREQRLELEFTDHSVRAFFEDRIADEYPSQRDSPRASADARSRLDDLFGGPGKNDG